MTEPRIGQPLIQLQQTDSTNTLLLHLLADDPALPEGTTVVAERQQAGRGRRGRSWFTAENALACSVLLKPPVTLAEAGTITLVASVAVHRALSPYIPDLRIKWPNDLLVRDAKLCGILTETHAPGNKLQGLVVGIGLNIDPPASGWPDDIAHLACSVNEHSTLPLSRDDCLQAILSTLDAAYRQWQVEGFAPFREAWQTAHAHQRQRITVNLGSTIRQGIAWGLDDDGALLLETEHGMQRVISGEVLI